MRLETRTLYSSRRSEPHKRLRRARRACEERSGAQGPRERRAGVRGKAPYSWIRDVKPPRSFVIEMPLDGATLAFEWRFEALSGRSTRLIQRVTLTGRNADAYRHQVEAAFASTVTD